MINLLDRVFVRAKTLLHRHRIMSLERGGGDFSKHARPGRSSTGGPS